jgi:hypothetical protein
MSDDTPSRFLDRGVTALRKFVQQGGFAAARAAGQDDQIIRFFANIRSPMLLEGLRFFG